ncbi:MULTISPECIES: hypothetical protein [Arcobacteraceae]|nr:MULTISPECIES: hypothetical protein [Arcobacteraceae]MBL3520417.1 hypothetical protein [Aliarcobacter lanthieri]
MRIKNKKSLYEPTNLQDLSKQIKKKVVEKQLNIFQKIFRFLFKKKS